jgi:endoglucanase
VVLSWMSDCLSLWREAGWGWAVWNFRGDFGVMDSGRADVAYEDFQGHKLDRKMLELLRQSPA